MPFFTTSYDNFILHIILHAVNKKESQDVLTLYNILLLFVGKQIQHTETFSQSILFNCGAYHIANTLKS